MSSIYANLYIFLVVIIPAMAVCMAPIITSIITNIINPEITLLAFTLTSATEFTVTLGLASTVKN
ncbi:hypothetical protein H5T51_09265 [Candidatus Bathyarchaeota archaeon]|nr:hypothetical protein [Candidatus Bathyarchaeota archaeon]